MNDWLAEEWAKAVDDTSDKYYQYLMANSEKSALEYEAARDEGFEAGVLAAENGLGRYDG